MEILRTRLCEWRPAGIDSLALAPASAPEPRLAVGRSNGVVELWNTLTWHLEVSTSAHSKRSIRSLLWLGSGGQRRLLSAGLHREITEWDVATLQPVGSVPSGGGPVWALSAAGGRLFAACEDGSLRIFSAGSEPGELVIEGRLPVGKTRLLSVAAFGPDHVFAGGSDSRIAKWSRVTRTCEASMQVERAKNAETLIWALAALGDHGLASADSLGLVQIWDPIACVVQYRFQQHQADVLALCASEDGGVLLSGGVDAKISTFSRQPSGEERWVFRNTEFGHTHDVRAIVLDEGFGPFVSGGVAGALRVTPLRLAAKGAEDAAMALEKTGGRRRRLLKAPLEICGLSPCLQTASVAQGSRLMLCQHDAQLELWYLQQPKPKDPEQGSGLAMPEAQHVLKVSLEGAKEGRHLSASAIAPDGRHFAASDDAGTRVFTANLEDLEVRRVPGLPAQILKTPARALLFCGTDLLAVAPQASSQVLLLDVARQTVAARLKRHEAPVALLAAEGEWLASADLDGVVHIFSLDSLQHRAQVPVGGKDGRGKPTALCFDAGRQRLIVAMSTHLLVIFDVEAQALATDVPALVSIPRKIVPAHARICGAVVPPGSRDKLLVWGHTFLAKLDLQAAASQEGGEDTPKKKKRRKSKSGSGAAGDSDEEAMDKAWRAYDGFQHILALVGLEESQWGGPLQKSKVDAGDGAAAQGGSKKRRGGGAKAGGGAEGRLMALTMEVSPGAVERSLPQAFERKQYNRLPTA